MINSEEKIDFDKIIKNKNIVDVIVTQIERINYHDNKPVGENIFELLEKKSIVLYYPLLNEKSNGMHIDRHENGVNKHYVYINTGKPYYDQIFTAAHELGHIINISDLVNEQVPDCNEMEENIVDRFAAEILMPRDMFLAQWKFFAKDIKKDNKIKVVDFLHSATKQMIFFKVSFASVLLRLAELQEYQIVFLKKLFKLVDANLIHRVIQSLLVKYNSNIDLPTSKKYITNLYDVYKEKIDTLGENDYNVLEIEKCFDINKDTINEDINKEI